MEEREKEIEEEIEEKGLLDLDDELDELDNLEDLDNGENVKSHEHHLIMNREKSWEARSVEMNSELSNKENRRSEGDTIKISHRDFWRYVKIVVVVVVLFLGYKYFLSG